MKEPIWAAVASPLMISCITPIISCSAQVLQGDNLGNSFSNHGSTSSLITKINQQRLRSSCS